MIRFIAAGAAALAIAATSLAAAEPVTAKTKAGVLVGDLADGIVSWKGVRYAKAPVGDLRWKPTQALAKSDEMISATSFGDTCLQGRSGAEDCLYLNVYAPEGAKNLPVMFWIHGGSNTGGAGSTYNGAAFAKSGVVYVSINYRMGALGFFAHPEITKAAAKDEWLANYGLMDQTQALKWVQENIASFGGDPNKVTVFGESAGAIDIYALLGAKSSKGLFHQAILESNITWGNSQALAAAETDGKALAIKAGAKEGATLADLKALPAKDLIANNGGAKFPILDGRYMVETSLQAVARGHALDIPTIVGSNSFEASLIAGREPRREAGAPPEAPEAVAARKQRYTDYTNSQAGAPARFIAEKTAGGKPSWLYFFSYVATDRRTPESNGASHASEISYVYGGSNRRPGAAAPEDSPTASAGGSAEDKAMAVMMHGCWVSFAKTGTPTCGDAAWPAYTKAGDQLMEFGSPAGVRTNFRKAELDKAQAAEKDAK